MDTHSTPQIRVLIRIRPRDIPGKVLGRPNSLGRLFCKEVLDRDFQPLINTSGFDFVHVPPRFETELPVAEWFICDLNIVSELQKEDLMKIKHEVYLASLVDGKW